MALLLGRRPVCLIDEPEMCLHPPQAYSLGKFIGRFGESDKHLTFVATHSSYFLRGIIETSTHACIIRLSRERGVFKGRLVNNKLIKEFTQKPVTRAETVLDGIFTNATILVEAEGDRLYRCA
ncbi:MAG: hypothetical protein AAB116_11880, partial [Candidatus Poribacteria bacterium]